MNMFEGWHISHFKAASLGMLKLCPYNTRKPIYSKPIWDIRFQKTRLSNIQDFDNIIPHFDLLLSWLPDTVQKCFRTRDGAVYLPYT